MGPPSGGPFVFELNGPVGPQRSHRQILIPTQRLKPSLAFPPSPLRFCNARFAFSGLRARA